MESRSSTLGVISDAFISLLLLLTHILPRSLHNPFDLGRIALCFWVHPHNIARNCFYKSGKASWIVILLRLLLLWLLLTHLLHSLSHLATLRLQTLFLTHKLLYQLLLLLDHLHHYLWRLVHLALTLRGQHHARRLLTSLLGILHRCWCRVSVLFLLPLLGGGVVRYVVVPNFHLS